MKKILALALALLMMATCVFTLASCKKQDLEFGKSFSALNSQMDVLLQLNAGSIDVGIMDSIMAGYYMSQDTTYANSLMIVPNLVLAEEQYGIAARKGSAFAKAISMALVELTKDGSVATIAAKYGLTSEVCIDTSYSVDRPSDAEMEDYNAIMSRGKFVVGYTLFAPIAYKEGDELVGFDIELAKAVAEYLGLEVEFKIIEWSAKEAELNSGTIDCIWNGMTITEERQANMAITIPYLYNKQVAVIRKDDKDKYTDTDSMKKAIIGAEDGSAGMSCVVKETEE